jgi:polar amino acid transport system substrate-binding protein
MAFSAHDDGYRVMANSISPDIVSALAPTGRLRVAINFGNIVLAQRDPSGGAPRGVSGELARMLAQRLGVAIDYLPFDAAGRVFEAGKAGAWDLAFLAIDPVRAAEFDFTPPYVVIEGAYVVPAGSPLRAVEDVDRDGVRVAVAANSAYDLFLTRALKHATLVRRPSGPEALEMFVTDGLEVAAGVRQPIVAFARTHPETRVIPGRFMAIEQAMAIPKGRSVGLSYLRGFIEEMKANGVVAQALAATGQAEATVAPPASQA